MARKTIFIIYFFIFTLMCGASFGKSKLALLNWTKFEFQKSHYIAIIVNHKKGWHTYFKNPGSAGQALHNIFYKNQKKVSLIEENWPSPDLFYHHGNVYTYGYKKQYILFYKLTKDLKHNDHFELHSNYIVCKKQCVSEKTILKATIFNSKFKSHSLNKQLDKKSLIRHLKSLPKDSTPPKTISFKMSKSLDGLKLEYSIKHLGKTPPRLLVPFNNKYFFFAREILTKKDGLLTGSFQIDWEGEYFDTEEPLPKNGVFKNPIPVSFLFYPPNSKEIKKITITIDSFLI